MVASHRGKSGIGKIDHQHTEVKCVEEKEPQRPWDDQSTAVQKTPTKPPPPECHFDKSEWGCKFGNECSFPHLKVDE